MCVETMDTNSKSFKDGCLRKTIKPASKLKWKLLRVTSEEEASKLWRTTAVKATVRKYLRREQKKLQLANLVKVLKDMDKEKKQPRYEAVDSLGVAFSRPDGAMAPENTTQYLMDNVYDDLCNVNLPGNRCNSCPESHETSADVYDESLSPSSVYVALDSAYESCLAFQQRDFEEVFGLCA